MRGRGTVIRVAPLQTAAWNFQMGTIDIHLNENQSLEGGHCCVRIKAWPQPLLPGLVRKPRRMFSTGSELPD